MNKIIDEFTELPISRQRKKQLRWQRDGLCELCGRPVAFGSTLCEKHLLQNRAWNRANRGSKQWHAGGQGRPPIERKALVQLAIECYFLAKPAPASIKTIADAGKCRYSAIWQSLHRMERKGLVTRHGIHLYALKT